MREIKTKIRLSYLGSLLRFKALFLLFSMVSTNVSALIIEGSTIYEDNSYFNYYVEIADDVVLADGPNCTYFTCLNPIEFSQLSFSAFSESYYKVELTDTNSQGAFDVYESVSDGNNTFSFRDVGDYISYAYTDFANSRTYVWADFAFLVIGYDQFGRRVEVDRIEVKESTQRVITSSVPEPGVFTLFALGLLSMLCLRRSI